MRLGPENRPRAQLALLGLDAEGVTEVVITHGDIDHIGGIEDFPSATIVLSRSEREAGAPRYFGDVRPLEWPAAARYRLLDGDDDLAPGVTLLATPGHSPGHLSLLVRLRETGAVVLACDAISREAEIATGINGGATDADAARRSAARLVHLARRHDALARLRARPRATNDARACARHVSLTSSRHHRCAPSRLVDMSPARCQSFRLLPQHREWRDVSS